MNIILTTGILLIVLSFIFQKNKKISPYWGFLLVFLIMGFQSGVEGDFMNYMHQYEAVAKGGSYDSVTSANDTVWIFLYIIFGKIFPFWAFIIVLAGFECKILYELGSRYGSKQYGWVGPILFFFTFYLMLIEMKALRQGLAVEITVLAYLMTTQKKGVLWSAALMIIATFVHHSSLLVVPFIVYQIIVSRNSGFDHDQETINAKHGMLFPIVMVVIYMIVYSAKSTSLGDTLTQLAMLGEAQNIQLSGYLESEQEHAIEISFLIVLYDAVLVFLCSWFYQRTTQRNKVFAIASIIGCFGDMLFFGMGSLPRMMTYFYVYNIITYPLLAEMIAKKYGKTAALVLIVFLVGYAMKTSLPMITSTERADFGTYRFVFMP